MREQEDEDVALKLLHTADWHLGRSFPQFEPYDQLKLTRARLEAVRRIVGLGNRYGVDAILCAGDLFDDPAPATEWWRGLAQALAKADGYPVFLLPGNHDPLMPSSVYSPEHPFRRELSAHVHVVDEDDFSYQLSEAAVLYAQPCRSQAGSKDLALELPAREPGDERIRIGMVHGQTFDIDGYQTNFPIAKDAGGRRGLDYLAVGDTHAFREVPPGTEVPAVYPSAPEATNFGERDTGYAALVFFGRRSRRPRIEREQVAQWRWREERCASLSDLERILDQPDLDRNVMRLHLQMSLSPADFDRAEQIVRQLKGTAAAHGRVGILMVDRDGLRLDTRNVEVDFEQAPEVLQAALRRLKGMEPRDPETARRAIFHLYRLVQAQG